MAPSIETDVHDREQEDADRRCLCARPVHKAREWRWRGVDWTVEGTHPLAGRHPSKADFVAGTFAKLNKAAGPQLVMQHLLVKDDSAVVEPRSLATARNRFRCNNHYCRLVHFSGTTIDRVRAYLDSAMVARLFAENPVS